MPAANVTSDRLRKAIARIDRYFFARGSMNRIGLFRIALAINILYSICDLHRIELQLLAGEGVYSPRFIGLHWLLQWVGAASGSAASASVQLEILRWMGMLSAAFMGLGLFSRVSAFVCFVSLSGLHDLNPWILKGADSLMAILSLMMALAPSGARFSLDTALWGGRKGAKKYAIWPLRLMQLQIAALYLVTGVLKACHESWRRGDAVYYITRIWPLEHFHLPYLLDHAWTLKLMSWGTVTLEIALGLLIPLGVWRWGLIVLGVGLHLGLEYCLFLPSWEWLMIGTYILMLPDSVEERLERWGKTPPSSSKGRSERIPADALNARDMRTRTAEVQ